MSVSPAFAALREQLDHRHREAAAAALAVAEGTVLATGFEDLDRTLGGGFLRGAISTIEGAPSSGRSSVAARLLAVATRKGLAALIGVDMFPPALEAAGVDLDRLLVVRTTSPLDAIRAADIVLRSQAFNAVVIPTIPSARRTGSAAWSRLASLAHRANAALVALGDEASQELRYFASLRLETSVVKVRWNGPSGHLGELAGYDVRAVVRKHKRAAPVGEAIIRCETFEDRPLFLDVRERTITSESTAVARLSAAGG